jgi:Flp pilus assembly protein TadG
VRRIRNIWRDQGGNAAIIFGLAVIPLIALGGGAVDLAYRGKVRGELQAAADTAAIAAARTLQQAQLKSGAEWDVLKADAEARAAQLLDATFARYDPKPTADIFVSEDTVRISLHNDVKTSFLGVIGINKLDAGGLAEVNVPDPVRVEVGMVLDYSGSMRDNDKYIRMTEAARNFIRKVRDDRGDRSKIGIVPFSEYVYATLPGGNIRGTPPAEINNPMAACLLNRAYPYSASGETPLQGTPESRWPQANPTDPKCQAYAAGNLMVRDLSNDFDGLDAALAVMQPAGLTNIALATEMGWQLLSPDLPFDAGRPYSDTKVEKILILLTDGMQTVKAEGPSGGVSTLAADEVTAENCVNAKAEGIDIYTIAFDIDEERIQNLLRGCATDPANYYDAREAADIAGVFDSIYDQISETVFLSR